MIPHNTPDEPLDRAEESSSVEPRAGRMRLPIARPLVTYVLLGLIVLAFLADLATAELLGGQIVSYLGAQVNSWIGEGEYWRLFTAIFLHAGITHLAFNAYALFSLGRDVEGFYGHGWFLVIYLLAGLAGSSAWYALGSDVPSVGASGAIFGLIGAEAAFFVRNRRLFGSFARERLGNLGVLIAINLVFGFTVPNINNIAHLGGLAAGFLLGLLITPAYALAAPDYGLTDRRELVDTRTSLQRTLAVGLGLFVLLVLVFAGVQRWG